MASLLDSILMLVFIQDLYVLGTGRLEAVIRTAAFQGVLLAATPVLAQGEIHATGVLIGLGTLALKGVVIPTMLLHSIRELEIRREVEPLIGLGTSMLLGGVAAGFALVFTPQLSLAPGLESKLIIPAALTTCFTGFILLTARRKAVTQVVGYLFLENGIFIFGLTLLHAVPVLVEIGVLLDLVVGIFVMGILLDHIQREFSSLDTRHITALKEP
ncbi:MAG: hydrogenase [Longimicrobiales bacterium]